MKMNASSLFNELDALLSATMSPYQSTSVTSVSVPRAQAGNKLPDMLCSSRTPPSNILVDKEKGSLVIEVALPGQKKEDINVEFENDYISVSIEKKEEVDSEKKDDDLVYLQKGIKSVKNKISFYVDPSRYDVAFTNATFENGLLIIEVEKQTRNRTDTKIKIS